jgi:hypothetical protein
MPAALWEHELARKNERRLLARLAAARVVIAGVKK